MPMGRRSFLVGAAAATAAATLSSGASTRASLPRPRNVLLLMADDLNLALSPWGHPAAHSPHLARLAAHGVRFSHAFCPYPLCGPSRSALLTGHRPEYLGMNTNEVDWRAHRPDLLTLPQIARAHGLNTIRYGKIGHQGMPEGSPEREAILARHGLPHTHFDPLAWDEEFGDTPYTYEQHAAGSERVLAGNPHGGSSLHTMRVANPAVLPDRLFADHAVGFLSSARAQDPFFLGVGFMKPHVPLLAPAADWQRYDDTDVRALMSPSVANAPRHLPPGALLRRSFHRGLTVDDQDHLYRGYLAAVSWMDTQLGRVLDALDASGQADDTLIVFVADHGYHLGQQGHWDKMMLFEPSLRIPLLFAGTGITAPGTTCDALVESIDVFPTVCRLMGWEARSQGHDLTPWITDPRRPSDRATFAWVQAGDRGGWSIRTHRYRYSITFRGDEAGPMLFDLTTDPEEMVNLALHPDYAAQSQDLQNQLLQHYPAATSVLSRFA